MNPTMASMSWRVLMHLLMTSLKNHELGQFGEGAGRPELLVYSCPLILNDHAMERAAEKAACALATKMFLIGKPTAFIDLALPCEDQMFNVSSAKTVNHERTVCVRVIYNYDIVEARRMCQVSICPMLK